MRLKRISLVLEGWLLLLHFEAHLQRHEFAGIRNAVRRTRVRSVESPHSAEQICRAADVACVLYFKQVHCLQRSAVTTLLLRRRGFSAEMIVGAQLVPFNSHAWVEIENNVVNDRPYMRELYQVLDQI